MATLFFSRNGRDENRADNKGNLSIEQIMQFFKGHKHLYSATPPLINPDPEPSPYAACSNVVVEIMKDEINEKFTKPGYYWFPELSPNDCEKLANQPVHK